MIIAPAPTCKICNYLSIDRRIRGFFLLFHAHDKVITDRRIDLPTRMATCNLLWAKAIQLSIKIEKKFPSSEDITD